MAHNEMCSQEPIGALKDMVMTEIYKTPNLGNADICLDVARMRQWAEQNIVPQKIRIDAEQVKRLLEGGTVTEDWVMGHTVHQVPKPILICEHPDGIGDEIVDGNHTYVAAAFQWTRAMEKGLISNTMTPFVLGYGLKPAEWRQFVIPTSRLAKTS
jgi:hypothetical protein